MTGRLIAIGDIHGCANEFAELLERLDPGPEDRIVLLGDLVNRGPDSGAVIDLARQRRCISLMGNHELRLLRIRKSGDRGLAKEQDLETYDRMRPRDWDYIRSLPLTFEEPVLNTVFVHGGFIPGTSWRRQGAEIVTRVQVVDRNGDAAKRSEAPGAPCWADLWTGPPFVVYGHTSRPSVYKLKWSIGIDTACVMGGHLTAYILPEKRLIQVKAHKVYFR